MNASLSKSVRLGFVTLFLAPGLAAAVGWCQGTDTVQAQTPGSKITAFDVASIRPNNSASRSASIEINLNVFLATNVTLKMLLQSAYGIRQDLVSGEPGWADSEHFNVQAKIVDADPSAMKKLTREQRMALLQSLLADRFQLKAHTETRTLPVYDLVLAKGGPKCKEVTPAESQKPLNGVTSGSTMGRNGQLTAHDVPVAALASTLAEELQRTIVDKTALSGRYDFVLTWVPDNGSGPSAEATAPPLFMAIQEQLGLKLQPGKGPVETLVVDHVDRPSEN